MNNEKRFYIYVSIFIFMCILIFVITSLLLRFYIFKRNYTSDMINKTSENFSPSIPFVYTDPNTEVETTYNKGLIPSHNTFIPNDYLAFF